MRTVYVLVSVLALATAAIQPNGPVYRSASVVNSSPIGKSLPNSNSPQQLPQPQHSAEERESQGFQPIESSNTGAVTSPVNPVAAPAPAPINPQVRMHGPSKSRPDFREKADFTRTLASQPKNSIQLLFFPSHHSLACMHRWLE